MSEIDVSKLLSEMRSMAQIAQGQPSRPHEAGEAGPGFATLLKASVDKVNGVQQQAGAMAKAFEAGVQGVSLPEVMVEMQKASVAFRAMTEVRNKLVAAYEDIMKMPI